LNREFGNGALLKTDEFTIQDLTPPIRSLPFHAGSGIR
jgi:hypothetical protein